FFSSRRRHTRFSRDWSSDVCSSDLGPHRRDHGRQAHPGPRAAVPPDRVERGGGRPRAGGRRGPDPGHRAHHRPHGRRDGGADGRGRCRPRAARHGEGRRPGRRPRRGPGRAQGGWQDRHVGPPGGQVVSRERTARVITASNRAAAGVYADRGGPMIVDWLRARGYETPDPVVVPDGEPVGEALRAAVADGVDVVITTGGTGISPTDATPEVTRAVLDYEVPGLADAIRTAGAPTVPTAVLSRGLAGVAGRTLVVNLPGSTGGVRDGLSVLAGVLDHAVDQLRGGDHR